MTKCKEDAYPLRYVTDDSAGERNRGHRRCARRVSPHDGGESRFHRRAESGVPKVRPQGEAHGRAESRWDAKMESYSCAVPTCVELVRSFAKLTGGYQEILVYNTNPQ